MIQTVPCPDADRLRALIADTDVPDYVELETHLARCSRCQSRLDEIAVGESGWLRDAARLAPTTPEAEMTRTLHRLRDEWPDDGPPLRLDFLKPSDQPGLLGTLGRYQVLEVIGRGAFGIVLKALDPDLLRPVAIKVLSPHLATSGTARQRFLREARAAAAVSHDHIVTIHAVESGELPFIVMEFVSGISLQARLDRDGPFPPRDIARIGHQAACGLAAAHSVGLVHRDIKPANILLENGVERVKITDFGLARAADDARLTQSGVAAGTPLYMSPEQARGDTVDHRSDLFGLGSVLYTLATGFPPFRAGSTMGVLNRIANDPPRPIRETVPDFPAALEAIIMQLLEKDPAGRYQLAADVSVRLSGFLADPQADPPRRRRRRQWWENALPIFAGILLLGTVVYFKTKQGTLIVNVEDPNIKVSLDGRELKITGAGPQEIRLSPGDYHVTAMKDGKPAKAVPEVVKVERDGKTIVTVTAIADPEPAADVDLEKKKEELGRLMQELVQSGKLQPGKMEPDIAKLSALMMEASNKDASPDKARQAFLEAYKIGQKLAIPPARPAPAAAAPAGDPEWTAKLSRLAADFDDIRAGLKATPVGALFAQPGPVADPEKVLTNVGLGGTDIQSAKRLLSVRDQFLQGLPKAQKLATQLPQAMKDTPAGQTPAVLKELESHYVALSNAIVDMNMAASELGAKPPPPKPIENPWDAKLKKLTDEFQALTDRVSKTTVGRVLLIVPPGGSADKLPGSEYVSSFATRRLLALRDQFSLLVPQFQKDIGRWEQAALACRTARVQFEAGRISADEAQKAELTLKDAERSLTTGEQTLAKIVDDFRKLANEIDPAPAAPDVEFKKVMAEYDGLVLRLANNSVGRILALVSPDEGWSTSRVEQIVGGDKAKAAKAIQLLELRSRVQSQLAQAETAIRQRESAVRQRSEAEKELKGFDTVAQFTAAIEKCEYEIKLRATTIRSLVDDFKTMAEELDPTPVPVDVDFKKVMAEYDALTLRLVNTPIGRILAIVPHDRQWAEDEMFAVAAADAEKRSVAIRLLNQRRRILDQSNLAEKALSNRTDVLKQRSDDPATRAGQDEIVRTNEHEAKIRVTALRGLIADLKKEADALDPPKK